MWCFVTGVVTGVAAAVGSTFLRPVMRGIIKSGIYVGRQTGAAARSVSGSFAELKNEAIQDLDRAS
jgi:hypothetical protein